MEGVFLAPAMTLYLSFLLRSEIGKDLEGRAPLLEFHLPIDNYGGWYNDEVRAPNTFITSQRGKHGYCLDSFSKTHLIGKDTI